MAFQIPLMRNDFDIYKMKNSKNRSIPTKQTSGRSRKASETHSLSTSPGTNDAFINSPSHRNLHHVSSAGSRYQFSRVNSRTSQSSLAMSPTKNQFASAPSPPKSAKVGSQNSLNKFHNRLVDKLRKAFKSNNSSSEEATRT
ncbi:CLUMA_CG014976, isoform A [Clunio marinus]|uniref:CLUMA_CG014976, isoform A n=1 Tax=Clunio marinus TaxID=568069 RepID=A0A1J1INM1_9DIPT|nr:CLUMA_CG014976, isoform A [Clunio marinus]